MSETTAGRRPVGAVRLVDLRDQPLDPAELLASVADAHAGGVNLFVGVVRDHDGGARVSHLEYSAHPSALERLEEVARGVVADFDLVAVAAVHRVGRLQVGETAVLVAASAAHRGQAYDASRALIDRLKQQVPVWKHQVFEDGRDEWVGTP